MGSCLSMCHCPSVSSDVLALRGLSLTFPPGFSVNGQDVARMVKSTRNVNSHTPIVALASFDRDSGIDASGSLFDAVLAKPLELSDVCDILPRLGFTKQPPRRSQGSLPHAGLDAARGSTSSDSNAAPVDKGKQRASSGDMTVAMARSSSGAGAGASIDRGVSPALSSDPATPAAT